MFLVEERLTYFSTINSVSGAMHRNVPIPIRPVSSISSQDTPISRYPILLYTSVRWGALVWVSGILTADSGYPAYRYWDISAHRLSPCRDEGFVSTINSFPHHMRACMSSSHWCTFCWLVNQNSCPHCWLPDYEEWRNLWVPTKAPRDDKKAVQSRPVRSRHSSPSFPFFSIAEKFYKIDDFVNATHSFHFLMYYQHLHGDIWSQRVKG